MDTSLTSTLPFQQNGHLYTRSNTIEVLLCADLPPYFPGSSQCAMCGEYAQLEIREGVVYAQSSCTLSEGLTTTITLAVPSGKLIVTDDLRPLYDVPAAGLASYNTALGQAQFVEAMAAQQCAYGPVGNTCPGLYRTGESTYVIASPAEDESAPLPGEYLAGICTDLWAYSIADFEDWKSRGGNPTTLNWTKTVVDVPPGTYRFTHHTTERSFDRDSCDMVVFAHIERIA